MWLRMIVPLVAFCLFLGLAFTIWFRTSSRRVVLAQAEPANGVSCSLEGADLQARRDAFASFAARAREIQPLETGYAFRFGFDTEALDESARLITGESRCCPFFDYRITVRPSDDLLLVEITGPEGAKQLLSPVVQPGR